MSEKLNETHFAEMLCTRFCHDIAGAVSAVNNGVEFLLDGTDPGMQKQATDLLTLSAKEALSKLQTYRMAYGRTTAGSESEMGELEEIISKFFENGRIKLKWKNNIGSNIGNEIRRILVNMILIVSASLVYGGQMEVEIDKKKIKITGTNDRIKTENEMKKILDGNAEEELTPYNVVAAFLASIAKEKNIKLFFKNSETKIEFSADY